MLPSAGVRTPTQRRRGCDLFSPTKCSWDMRPVSVCIKKPGIDFLYLFSPVTGLWPSAKPRGMILCRILFGEGRTKKKKEGKKRPSSMITGGGKRQPMK